MSYNDEEKRHFVLGKLVEILDNLTSWNQVKTFVNGVTPEKLKARLKEAFQASQVNSDVVIADEEKKKANDTQIISEIDNL